MTKSVLSANGLGYSCSFFFLQILLEKRLGLAQLCLLSIVLVFMAFTRSASLGTSVLDGISASDGMIARARKSSGVWRSIRTKSDPDRPKIPAGM